MHLNYETLAQFAYLFVTDLTRVPYGHTYETYEKEEKGYAECWLKAYIEAFNMPMDGQLTHERIKKIHEIAMDFQKDGFSGKYKNQPNNFLISPNILIDRRNNQLFPNFHYSASKEGIEEFLEYWMISSPHGSTHLFGFFNQKTGEALGFRRSNEGGLEMMKVNSYQDPSREFHKTSFEDAVKNTMYIFAQDFECMIDSMIEVPEEKIHDKVTQTMKRIMDTYHEEMRNLDQGDSDKKIQIIAKTIQRITQLHPFCDGNIRTCYILLNKLLRDHGLPLTLLINPNRFDCCSVKELVEMIKEGQLNFSRLKEMQGDGNFTFKSECELFEALKSIQLSPQRLYDVDSSIVQCFIGTLLNITPLIKDDSINLAPEAYHFDENGLIKGLRKLIPEDNSQLLLILQAAEGKNYNLVFRRACAFGNKALIQFIQDFINPLGIDLNEPSSNGKTPQDWLRSNKNLDPEEKQFLDGCIFSSSHQNKIW